MTLPQTAPLDMVMPAGPQLLFAVMNVLPMAAMLVYAERYRRRTGLPLGYAFLLAGAVSALHEPQVCALAQVWFPKPGNWKLFEAFGVAIPWWMVPVYGWYVGGQSLIAYERIERGARTADLFALYAVFALVNPVLEIPGLQLGLYTYYGDQPFVVGRFPLCWAIANALMPMVLAGLAYRLRDELRGARRWLLAPLGLAVAGLTNGAVSAPIFLALHSGAGLAATHAAALVSLGFGLLACKALCLAVARDEGPVVEARAPSLAAQP